jgi:hypothetical protein
MPGQETIENLKDTNDAELLSHLKALMTLERKGHAEFLAALSEVDVRKLYLAQGYASLFSYCTKRLGLSEASAAKRTQVARCARRFPLVLELIAAEKLTLSSANMLAAHLDENNYKELLTKAERMTKTEVEKLIAISFPKPDCGDVIRKLPVTCPGAGNPVVSTEMPLELPLEAPSSAAPKPRPESIIPLSASRTKFQFSGDDELLAMFRTLRARLSRKYPMGRMEEIIKEAFLVLLEKTDPGRETGEKRSSKKTRHVRQIPSPIRREVFRRDGERCTFVSREGVRCDGRHYLEVDHVIPWSMGGSSREASNLTVRCRAHNAWRGGARPVQENPASCFWHNPRSVDPASNQDLRRSEINE